VKSPRVILGIVLALVLAVMTGSVLLLGYVVAGASLLLVVGVLLRKAARRYARSAIPSLHTPWLGRQRSRGGVTTYVEDEVRAGAMSATDPGAANRLRGDQPKVELLALRVRAEYLEMPGLYLTLEQRSGYGASKGARAKRAGIVDRRSLSLSY